MTITSPRRWRNRAMATAVGVGLVAAACGGGGGGGVASTDTNDSLVGLLRFVPDTAGNRRFLVGTDFERAASAGGLTIPGGTDEDQVADYLTGLGGVQEDSPVSARFEPFQQPFEVDAWRAEFGFSAIDTKRFLIAGELPTSATIFVVSRSTDQIEAALKSDEIWSDELQTETAAGTDYYTWADASVTNLARRSPPRPLGRGGQLALVEGAVIRTYSVEALVPVLSSIADGPSLADNVDVVRATGLLAEAGAYDLVLSDDVASIASAESEQPALNPYTLLAFGSAVDGDTPLEVLVLLHADAEGASANVERLRTVTEDGESAGLGVPWSTVFTIRSIEADGNAVVAIFESERPLARLYKAFLARDTLFAFS